MERGFGKEEEEKAPELEVLKEGPGKVKLGEKVKYRLEIRNKGKSIAENVLIYEEIAAGMRL